MADVISTGRGLGNIAPPFPGTGNGGAVNQLIGLSWGAGGGYGGLGMGGAMNSLLLKRRLLQGAAPYPGGGGPTAPDGGGRGEPNVPGTLRRLRPDTGVLGQLGMTPEGWVQNRFAGDIPFSQLQNLVDTRTRVNQMLGQRQRGPGFVGQGAGYGLPEDPLKKLIQQRLAANP